MPDVRASGTKFPKCTAHVKSALGDPRLARLQLVIRPGQSDGQQATRAPVTPSPLHIGLVPSLHLTELKSYTRLEALIEYGLPGCLITPH
ncbi:hypothetical protein RRG08_057079 [Elysia crispata]|uniref:Uncharacterized protein n=1 Tax=Elysia crispata TaxID=231223 RepID=A0AAE1ALZ2_9GAST|nr:hypothetical protein RRG08_057079 [Elysia crispata]